MNMKSTSHTLAECWYLYRTRQHVLVSEEDTAETTAAVGAATPTAEAESVCKATTAYFKECRTHFADGSSNFSTANR